MYLLVSSVAKSKQIGITPERISNLIPRVKIIALLRNPTDRAISHYFHEKRNGKESLPIHEALEKEETRLAPVIEQRDYKNDVFRYYSYKARGLYKDQLERYLNHFPREQIFVIKSEELFSKPDITLNRVFEYLGVSTDYKVQDLKPRNVANNRSDVAPDIYEYLNKFFRIHNKALYELVGEDYDW